MLNLYFKALLILVKRKFCCTHFDSELVQYLAHPKRVRKSASTITPTPELFTINFPKVIELWVDFNTIIDYAIVVSTPRYLNRFRSGLLYFGCISTV